MSPLKIPEGLAMELAAAPPTPDASIDALAHTNRAGDALIKAEEVVEQKPRSKKNPIRVEPSDRETRSKARHRTSDS